MIKRISPIVINKKNVITGKKFNLHIDYKESKCNITRNNNLLILNYDDNGSYIFFNQETFHLKQITIGIRNLHTTTDIVYTDYGLVNAPSWNIDINEDRWKQQNELTRQLVVPDLEMHLYHISENKRIVIIAIPLNQKDDIKNIFFYTITNNIPPNSGESNQVEVANLNISSILPKNKSFFFL